tara:strand:- start:22 stop:525 length:504 start_codon:yes stop_codon:yes gene_type:complete
MATLSLTTHFTVDIDDDDSHTITGGSTTATDSFTITHYFDKRYELANTATAIEIWSDSLLSGTEASDFDFLWIEADQTVELQLVCSEGGTVSGGNLQSGFCVKLIAGVPFILGSDDSRNMGNVTLSESEINDEMDEWETHWVADTIDRIECYNSSGSTANIRVFAAT